MSSETCPSRSLIRMRPSATIQEAAQLMCDMSMGALGVDTADHELLGLITERDLLWAMAQGKDPTETSISGIVNDFPIIVDGPISVSSAAERMVTGHVRHLLIRLDGDVNIVSLRDLVAADTKAIAKNHLISASEMHRMVGSRQDDLS